MTVTLEAVACRSVTGLWSMWTVVRRGQRDAERSEDRSAAEIQPSIPQHINLCTLAWGTDMLPVFISMNRSGGNP